MATAFHEGQRVEMAIEVKQVGWTVTRGVGEKGTVKKVARSEYGTTHYLVAFDNGMTDIVVNGHIVLREVR
ncbi:MAG: hypothetical protein PHS14_00115 [Elusimicrobia bacterium]|nr:hypothetical protein [Elusimicrobiota bacterium]